MTKPLRFRYERTKYGSHPKCVPAPCGLYRPPRRQIFLPASRTSCVRHRADARRPAPGGRRRTEEQPFPLPSPAIGPVRHRPPCPVVRSVCADRRHLGKTTPQARLLLRSVCTIFTEDRRHLGKTTPRARLLLPSVCTIFTEDRLHLGKTTPQARLLLRSVCTIFAGTKLPHHAFCRLFRR